MLGANILVADDDPNVRELARVYFGREGMEVRTVETGEAALEMLGAQPADVIILDVMMPGLDGFAVCREVRRTSDVPVLMLTAKGEEIDRVMGLELGADDYVVKPFSPRELVARVKAMLRRTRNRPALPTEQSQPDVLTYPGLAIDPQAREVLVAGHPIPLAPKEFDLLLFLAKNPRQVLDREQILTQVWSYDFIGETRTVDVHVKKLRLKLGNPARNFIHTVWGIGYKFEVIERDGD